MLAQFITGLLALLLTLFPNSLSLRASYQSRTFNTETMINMVMDAIMTEDIEALEAMMCKNIKQNVPDIRGQIRELIDSIDRDVFEFSQRFGTASYSESDRDGRRISQTGVSINIKTSVKDYYLAITWEFINNFSPDERGIRHVGISEQGQPGYIFFISATEGVARWHD